MNYNSLPTVEQANLSQYYDVIRRFDPELYRIKIALTETGVNPMVIPDIIRTIGNLSLGTGHGRIQIYMRARMITNIKPEENIEVNEEAVIDK